MGQFQGLLVAEWSNSICGAAWLQRQGRKRGLVWPPRVDVAAYPLSEAESEQLKQRLLDATEQTGRDWGLSLLQALLPHPDSTAEGAPLQRSWQAGDVLEFLVAGVRSPVEEPGRLSFRAVQDATEPSLAAVVRDSYESTLDCVCLEGMIDAVDALDDYASLGTPRDDRFWLATYDGSPVGCLVLADHAENDQVELAYMGLVPAARGKGWGRLLVEHALRVAAAWGRKQIVLAVDERNWPAREQYLAAGFWKWDARRVWLKRL